ncbi:transmembrane protease serine 2-like [Pelobates fuscus]|uniref:transmembrane protease serine 2-like n=1 Tax=Pelobates fuscus TaxID=191477 RepID=UPI002FE43D63
MQNPPNVYDVKDYDNSGFQRDFTEFNIYENLPPPYTPSQLPPPPPYQPYCITQPPVHLPAPAMQGTKPSLCSPRCKACALIGSAICVMTISALVIAWYFGNSSKCEMKCWSSSQCVSASQWCDGTVQCPNGEDEAYCVRLYGPEFLLQAYSSVKGRWLNVCSDKWNDNFGKAACRELGYNTSTYYKSGMTWHGYTIDGYAVLNSSSPNGKLQNTLSVSVSCRSLVGVSLQCIECGSKDNSTSSRIVGGNLSSINDWPWQVSLYSSGKFTCGGSIITPNWIVTAAHCIEGSNTSVWQVYYGSVVKGVGSSSYVDKVIAHQSYDATTKNNDIALMKLKSTITFSSTARPVCLPNHGMNWVTENQYWISGWGSTYEGGPSTSYLREASVKLIDSTTCNTPSVYNNAITSTMICAGDLSGGIDACQGDSGGPLVTQTNNLWWLVGDTSRRNGCANVNKPGVYGNVTVFLEWIYLQMKTYR